MINFTKQMIMIFKILYILFISNSIFFTCNSFNFKSTSCCLSFNFLSSNATLRSSISSWVIASTSKIFSSSSITVTGLTFFEVCFPLVDLFALFDDFSTNNFFKNLEYVWNKKLQKNLLSYLIFDLLPFFFHNCFYL